MLHAIQLVFTAIDHCIAKALLPLGAWILVSGADDCILDCLFFFSWFCFRFLSKRRIVQVDDVRLRELPEKRIAIFIPLWHEHRVIGNMVKHNFSVIKYRNYQFFIGAYPNDHKTVDAIQGLEKSFPTVHLATTPHDGPTSKADCLNWIYQRMLAYEQANNCHFDVIMTHDAEDLIHADSLRLVNYYSERYDMVQVPVLPLPTPMKKATHGIYCDEFCETQIRDMPARRLFSAFIPSCGVGTAFSRSSLDRLARVENNRIFEPTCLTEDYENGIRLHDMGAAQIFLPVQKRDGSFVATREFFPQTFRSAVKQRTRWVMGISLQTWARHGWQGGLVQKYWLWRDRKGLIGNPVSLLTNAISLYAVIGAGAGMVTGVAWGLARIPLPAHFAWLFWSTTVFGSMRLLVRMVCVARVYGAVFALGVPVRMIYANAINSAATLIAIHRYAKARIRNEPLAWLKTDHSYPTQAALSGHKRRLREVLVGSEYITQKQLDEALTTRPAGMLLGQRLIDLGYLAETDLYEALSLQQSLPLGRVYPNQVKKSVARTLPREIVKTWRVLPFRMDKGNLFVAGTELPSEEMHKELRRFTALEIQFQLITPENFAELTQQLL